MVKELDCRFPPISALPPPTPAKVANAATSESSASIVLARDRVDTSPDCDALPRGLEDGVLSPPTATEPPSRTDLNCMGRPSQEVRLARLLHDRCEEDIDMGVLGPVLELSSQ